MYSVLGYAKFRAKTKSAEEYNFRVKLGSA